MRSAPLWSLLLSVCLTMKSVHAEVIKTSTNQDKVTAEVEGTSVNLPAKQSETLTPKELD